METTETATPADLLAEVERLSQLVTDKDQAIGLYAELLDQAQEEIVALKTAREQLIAAGRDVCDERANRDFDGDGTGLESAISELHKVMEAIDNAE